MKDKNSTQTTICYDRYPFWIICIGGILSLLIYALGIYIMFTVHFVAFAAYILYILWMEIRLLRNSCKDCWYYGKVCAFGKGRLACYVTKRGNPEDFIKKTATWRSIIPDLLVMAVPVIAGIVLMIIDFDWVLLVSVILILVLSSVGNGYVRGQLACKYCRQREIGCPADRLFDRSKSG
ncbi:MAG: hypothetical protein JW712_13395 [Dehalococcoidales bacterium]|nr:hypothetical protein [Dehalococcoidales bacterium]